MSREEDGVVLAEILDQVAHGADLIGIEADGRLVEDEQVGVVHHGIGPGRRAGGTLSRACR